MRTRRESGVADAKVLNVLVAAKDLLILASNNKIANVEGSRSKYVLKKIASAVNVSPASERVFFWCASMSPAISATAYNFAIGG